MKLDARSHTVVASWPMAGCDSPSGMAIDRVKHRLFSVCDGKKMAILSYGSGKLLSLAAIGDSSDAAAFDNRLGLAFSSNGDGTLSVIDANKPGYPSIATLATSKGGKTMAYDKSTGRIFVPVAKYGPAPAPTAATPRPRPAPIPDSFEVLVLSK